MSASPRRAEIFRRKLSLSTRPGCPIPFSIAELTRQYIRRANAVFVCVDAQKVYHEEVKTITSVFAFSANNKSKVHIIATHWDVLNDPDADWHRQKEYLIKLFVGSEYYDYELPDDLDKIKSKTNIAAIMRIISDKLVHDYKKLMIEDIQKRLEEKRLKRDSVQQVSTQLFLTSIDARNEFGDGNQQSGIELDR